MLCLYTLYYTYLYVLCTKHESRVRLINYTLMLGNKYDVFFLIRIASIVFGQIKTPITIA